LACANATDATALSNIPVRIGFRKRIVRSTPLAISRRASPVFWPLRYPLAW
jgi:hypothetical protein